MLLSRFNRLDAAETGHRRTVTAKPGSEESLCELVMPFVALGKPAEALKLLLPALDAPRESLEPAVSGSTLQFGQPEPSR
jgi:hypothetical protein